MHEWTNQGKGHIEHKIYIYQDRHIPNINQVNLLALSTVVSMIAIIGKMETTELFCWISTQYQHHNMQQRSKISELNANIEKVQTDSEIV